MKAKKKVKIIDKKDIKKTLNKKSILDKRIKY